MDLRGLSRYRSPPAGGGVRRHTVHLLHRPPASQSLPSATTPPTRQERCTSVQRSRWPEVNE